MLKLVSSGSMLGVPYLWFAIHFNAQYAAWEYDVSGSQKLALSYLWWNEENVVT
jgi:hypothetical protein